jgi:hypothetical protein
VSAAAEMARVGVIFFGVGALLSGGTLWIFGGFAAAVLAVGLFGFCLVIWLLFCGLFYLIGGPD